MSKQEHTGWIFKHYVNFQNAPTMLNSQHKQLEACRPRQLCCCYSRDQVQILKFKKICPKF